MAKVPGTISTAMITRKGRNVPQSPNSENPPPAMAPARPVQPPIHIRYASQAAMIADQANQKDGHLYFDGSNSWWWKGTNNGLISDYEALTKTNTLTGTGTANYIPKFTGAGTIGNSIIFDQGTRVGINNTNPRTALDVNGSIRATGFETPSIGIGLEFGYYATGGYGFMYAYNRDTSVYKDLALGVQPSQLYLKSDGKVGFNTTAPSDTVDINGTARIRTRANGGSTFAKFDATGVFMERTLTETKSDLGISSAINGSAVAGQVAFWDSANTQAGNSGFTWEGVNKTLKIETNSGTSKERGLQVNEHNTGVQGAIFQQKKSRGTSTAPTDVASGDIVGVMQYAPYVAGAYTFDRGYFGGVMTSATGISAVVVAGTTNDNYSPSLLVHHTGKVGIGLGGSIIANSVVEPTDKLDVNGTVRVRTRATGGTTFAKFDTNGVLMERTLADTKTDLGLTKTMGTVVHGTTATVARPTGYDIITWIGSVEPTNALDNDVWQDTSA